MARPSDYTEELILRICERIACGESMRSICRDDAMPAMSTVFLWLTKHKEFSEHYETALRFGTAAMEEDLLEIADDSSKDTHTTVYEGGVERTSPNTEWISRSRLRVDARKWIMSKRAPRKYGDKLDHQVSGGLTIEKIERIIVDPPIRDGKGIPPAT